MLRRAQKFASRRGSIRRRILAGSPVQLMKARFQGVTLGAQSNGYGAILGTDSRTGWNWTDNTVFGAKPRIQYIGGNASAAIVSATDYQGVTSQVLQVSIAGQTGIDQCILLLEPTETLTEFIMRGRLKLAANIATALGGGGWLAPGPELKSAGDYRINCQVGNLSGPPVTPRFNVAMDNNANGGLPPNGQMTNFYGSPVYNFDAAVPVGVWYQYELYVRRSNTTGRITWKINGATVFDMDNIDTIGVNNAEINRLMLGSAYASGANTVQIDDVEVLDASGSSETPEQNTTPQTLFMNHTANSSLTSFRNLATTSSNVESEGAGGVAGGAVEELLTNGTLAAQFITQRAPAGGFTLPSGSTVSFKFTGNDPNGSGYRLRAKLIRRSAAGVETAIGTFDDNANLGAYGAYTWNGVVPSNVVFAEDDRLGVRYLIFSAAGGVMPGGYVSFAVGAPAGGNVSTVTLPTTVSWKAAP